jgi:hypothetical protein
MQPTPSSDSQQPKYQLPNARIEIADGAPKAADAVLRVVKDIGSQVFGWEDRSSDNKKAVRVVVDGFDVLIDVHPCRMGTVQNPHGFFMGGAYVRRGGRGNECNLDQLAEQGRDDLGFDLRDLLIRHFAQLFPAQIAAMIADKDAKSDASTDVDWRQTRAGAQAAQTQTPPANPGTPGTPPAPAGWRPWHEKK